MNLPSVLLPACLLFFLQNVRGQDMPQIMDLGENPGNLRLFVHEPDSLSHTDVPLLVVLHGCNQDAHAMMRLSGWNKLADENGFIVAYPEQKGSNNMNRCFNWFGRKDNDRDEGEVASIISMIHFMKAAYPIDQRGIYITGVSAGAAMAVTMAALYPTEFSGVASYAGGPYGLGGNMFSAVGGMLGAVDRKPWEWARRVRAANGGHRDSYPKMIVLHGTQDPVVNPVNAGETVEQWVDLHELDREADSVETAFNGNSKVNRTAYSDTSGTEMVVRYDLDGLGHVLAIDPGPGKDKGGRKGIFSADIDFHSTYWLAVEFGLIGR